MSTLVRMADIIKDAAGKAYQPRKRKEPVLEVKKAASSSILDGVVDNLFSFSSTSMMGVPASRSGTSNNDLNTFSSSKSELVFDSEGNMVLQTTDVRHNALGAISGEATTTVDSSSCRYDYAYRKPKPTKWSPEETMKFYEALELYGPDQMLINTVFPQYNPTQIRQKFKAEMRNAPDRFNKALYAKKRKVLNSAKFEEQHGQIKNPVYMDKMEFNLDKIEEFADGTLPENPIQASDVPPITALDDILSGNGISKPEAEVPFDKLFESFFQ